jgi:hypothetical protein
MTWNVISEELQGFVLVCGYLIFMLALVALSLSGLLALLKQSALSTIDGDVLTLTFSGRTAFNILVGLTFVGSLIAGAYGRVYLKPQFVGSVLLALLALAFLWGLTVATDDLRSIALKIGSVRRGDNASVASFVVFWAVMVSYAAKAFWDELRDRLAALIDAKFNSGKQNA